MSIIVRVIISVSVVVLVLLLYGGNDVFTNQYDDAYITYRYAVNLTHGNGLVYNTNEHVDAASSFMFTVILSVIYLFGVSPEISSIIVSLLSLFIITMLLTRTCYEIF